MNLYNQNQILKFEVNIANKFYFKIFTVPRKICLNLDKPPYLFIDPSAYLQNICPLKCMPQN